MKGQKQTWGSFLPHPGPFAFFIVLGPLIVILALNKNCADAMPEKQ